MKQTDASVTYMHIVIYIYIYIYIKIREPLVKYIYIRKNINP